MEEISRNKEISNIKKKRNIKQLRTVVSKLERRQNNETHSNRGMELSIISTGLKKKVRSDRGIREFMNHDAPEHDAPGSPGN